MREKGKGRSSKRTLKLSTPSMFMLVLLVSIAIAFTVPTVTPVMGQEAEVTVTVNAPESVEKGGTFNVTIDVDSVTSLNIAQFDLSFDSKVVEVEDVTEGDIDGEEIPIDYVVDSDTITVISGLPQDIGVNGSGYLAKISFEVKGKEGDESVLDIDNGFLFDNKGEEIPVEEWIDAKLSVEEEEGEEEEEVGEEVTPGSPNITVWKPAAAVVSNAVGDSRAFNITVDQIASVSWQINGTEVQTNESVKKAVFTKSAVIGTWNVSAIATNTTTGLSDMHTWIWSVTLTAITPTPTLAPGVTPTPTLAPGETPMPATPTPTIAHKKTPKPATPTPTPTPKSSGFEVIFTIAMLLAIAYMLLWRR